MRGEKRIIMRGKDQKEELGCNDLAYVARGVGRKHGGARMKVRRGS